MTSVMSDKQRTLYRREVGFVFQRLHRDRGLTLVLATHDPAVAARCDRVIQLQDGAVSTDAIRPVTR